MYATKAEAKRELDASKDRTTKNRKKGRKLCYLSQRGQIQPISTITYMGKQKFDLSVGGYASLTRMGKLPILPHSRQC